MKMASSQDVRFSEGAIEEGRKLAQQALERRAPDPVNAGRRRRRRSGRRRSRSAGSSRGSRRSQRQIEGYLAAFDFSHLVDELYHLTFDDFCDWYAEAIKPRLYGGDADARATALAALERLLKLLHPAMPHVTEEIWSNLPARETRLIVAPWPEAGDEAEAGALDARAGGRGDVPAQRRARPALEGDEKRIFDVVVKPERQKANGNVEAERERLRGEIARAEKMLANERFVAERAAPRSSRRSGRSSSGTAASSMQSRD